MQSQGMQYLGTVELGNRGWGAEKDKDGEGPAKGKAGQHQSLLG